MGASSRHLSWGVRTGCRSGRTGEPFKLRFDRLVVAVGSESNTFNIPGVRENAFFLKEVEHAARIREKVMENFEKAALPSTLES